MTSLSLLEIQRLQFSDRDAAAAELGSFLRDRGVSDVVTVEVNPKPESLNSVNGFVTLESGERLFFKTHVEEEEKLGEYYRGQLLSEAGYPVVSPERVRSVPGEQIVFYRPISFPTLFDRVKIAEDDERAHGSSTESATLVRLQRDLDCKIAELYRATAEVAPERGEDTPIQQLFSHRLRSDGRYGLFYDAGTIEWKGVQWPCRELFAKRWVINGVPFPSTIEQLALRARTVLAGPEDVSRSLTVIGHGDAHNGNVFVDEEGGRLLYFDPAFAGRHDPILDLVKPLFHNIFARWMYHPLQAVTEIGLEARITESSIELEHDFAPSALRRSFLDLKLELLLPTVSALLKEHALNRDNARERMRAALLCCPLLTVNLAAKPDATGPLGSRYPSGIRLLALSLAMEVGAVLEGAQTTVSSLVSCADQVLLGN